MSGHLVVVPLTSNHVVGRLISLARGLGLSGRDVRVVNEGIEVPEQLADAYATSISSSPLPRAGALTSVTCGGPVAAMGQVDQSFVPCPHCLTPVQRPVINESIDPDVATELTELYDALHAAGVFTS